MKQLIGQTTDFAPSQNDVTRFRVTRADSEAQDEQSAQLRWHHVDLAGLVDALQESLVQTRIAL